MTVPPITPETFPYRRQWTKAQVADITDRYMRLADAMTDAVGPAGQYLNVDPSCITLFAVHLALAGGDVHDELAYITAVIRNGDGLPANFHQWVLKNEYEPAPPDPDVIKAKADAAAEQIRRQLSPEVRKAVLAMFVDEYKKATQEGGGL